MTDTTPPGPPGLSGLHRTVPPAQETQVKLTFPHAQQPHAACRIFASGQVTNRKESCR